MAANIQQVLVPNIGGAENVDVIEILVKDGDQVAVDDPLITLEGDKATMEVPSPLVGVIQKVSLAVGDKVSEGALILTMEIDDTKQDQNEQAVEKPVEKLAEETEKQSQKQSTPQTESKPAKQSEKKPDNAVSAINAEDLQAGPGVRRLAHELEVDLTHLAGSGNKGRITKQDVQQQYLTMHAATTGTVGVVPAMPVIDFSQFGEIDTQALSKIQKISGANLQRNWANIPHVTQFEQADITALEAFRKQQKPLAEKQDIRLTPLVFIMKAVVCALRKYPMFNASLAPDGQSIILKKYFHIGIAVDTPNGLVVAVIRDVDKKGIFQLAQELGEISLKAREKGLGMQDMQGGCFTISSLGGIGGTAFTPIINAPEVAILGVSRSKLQPVYQADGELASRLMLPLSLSYDHRVIDGAQGARFVVYLSELLSDIRNLLL